MSKISSKLIQKIIDDLINRKGLRQEWEQIGPDIQNEIRFVWLNIAEEALEEYRQTIINELQKDLKYVEELNSDSKISQDLTTQNEFHLEYQGLYVPILDAILCG